MSLANPILLGFNRGLQSRYGEARIDLKRTGLAARRFHNCVPLALGRMMLRPGLGLYGGSTYNDLRAYSLPFIFNNLDTRRLELTDTNMRVWNGNNPVTNPATATTVLNGDFSAGTNWTDTSEAGASSNVGGGELTLQGTNFAAAIAEQTVSVAGGDLLHLHALRIVVSFGPVTLRVGSTSGDDDLIAEAQLKTGTHSLRFVPTGDFTIQFKSTARYSVAVTGCQIEAGGTFVMPTPWAIADVPLLRFDQSGDVIFVDGDGVAPYRIERRRFDSWSIVEYFPTDGPFLPGNLTTTTITPSAQQGDISLASNRPLFKSGHVGALFRITSTGQNILAALSGADEYTDTIRVTGVGTTQRRVVITRAGTWVGTLTLQQSVDNGDTWTAVTTYTTNATVNFDDTLDNQIVLYRIGFVGADYTSGTANITMTNPSGAVAGVVRITAFSDESNVDAKVFKSLGGTDATSQWEEGLLSTYRGWPTSCVLAGGRLWHFGRARVLGSVSDGFESYDDSIEGDSGPIVRSIGSGPVDVVNWAIAIGQIIMGTDGREITVRSSSLEEDVTPTNFNLKDISTVGTSALAAIRFDDEGFYVNSTSKRLFRLTRDDRGLGYQSLCETMLVPDLLSAGVVRLAVQRNPEMRLHCVMADGTMALLIYDRFENVSGWFTWSTDGFAEDVTVIPNPASTADDVIYIIRRTIDGDTKRYHERIAPDDECVGGTINLQGDSYVSGVQVASSTISGLDHLEGEEVVVWADGRDFSPGYGADQTLWTVSAGAITGLPAPVVNYMVGLPYTGQWESSKLAYAAELGSALSQEKRVDHVGLLLADTQARGIRYGKDFNTLQELPTTEDGGQVTNQDHIWPEYDKEPLPFDGSWDADSRICIEMQAPRPASVLAITVQMQTNEA